MDREALLTPPLATARERARALAHLNAFISLTDEAGDGPVVAVKDMMDVAGAVTTAGAPVASPVPAAADAAVVGAIREHGCVVIGKANLHPWSLGVTGENSFYGDACHPADPRRVAGGSSSGSAIAVATGMCAWAIGTDTGGSIRIPASLCGVVGFKPTFGALSTDGVVPVARSLDTVGALAPSVAAAAAGFAMMGGRCDLADAFDEAPELGDLAVAVPAGWVEGLDEETAKAWRRVSEGLPEIELPPRAQGSDAALTVLFAEAAALHRERMERDPGSYPADMVDRMRERPPISPAEHQQALDDCRRFGAAVEAAMAGWDALLLPATACVAPPRGRAAEVVEPLTRFTRPFNATGQPVAVLPVPGARLPVGAQIVGHAGRDAALLRVAAAVERGFAAPAMVGGHGGPFD